MWALWYGNEQKVGWRGCEGFRPIVGRRVASSLKTRFQLYHLSRPRWLAARATHIPRRPKKKPLRGKKVGSAEKKLRLWQKWCIVCIKGSMSLPMVACQNRPSEAHRFGCGFLQAALQASPFACMEKSTIRHLRWRVCPSRQFDKFVTWAGW